MEYVKTPRSIKVSEMIENHFCFAPSKYSAFYPKDIDKFEILGKVVDVKNKKVLIEKTTKYRYVEIGDIDVASGAINYEDVFGAYLPTLNPQKIDEGDILVSTVRTYRKGIAINMSGDNNVVATPAFLVLNNVRNDLTKEYVFSVLRSNFFIEQILSFQNRGMYPRLDRETIDYVYVPLPPNENVLNYVTLLQRALINKENVIRSKNSQIIKLIERELLDNQKSVKFYYNFPSSEELKKTYRIDAGYYCESYKYKQFLIKNYVHSARPIEEFGYEVKRGQNLQESAIGKIIESPHPKPNYYTVIRPTNFSDYGTISYYDYLGNPNKLSTLNPGDIVFSAEGTIGKCILYTNKKEKAITNIHGIILSKKDNDINESAFIVSFLRFLRQWGVFDYISVGGQGGSLAMQYWKDVYIANFHPSKKMEIGELYYKEAYLDNSNKINFNNFLEFDKKWNNEAGIIQIEDSVKLIRAKLEEVLHKIVEGDSVETNFNFLN